MQSLVIFIMYLINFRNLYFFGINYLDMGTFLFPILGLYLLKQTEIYRVEKKTIGLFIIFINFICIHIITKIINLDNEFLNENYISLVIKGIIYFIEVKALLLIIEKILKKKNYRDFVLESYIIVVLIDLILGVVRKIFPFINKYYSLFEGNDVQRLVQLFEREGNRLLPLGGKYFAGGFFAGTALIVLVYLINKKNNIKYWLYFILLSILGILVARTTLVGVCLSLIYYLFFNKKNIKKLIKIFILVLVIVIIFIVGIAIYPKLFKWGGELFLNKFKTASTNHLQIMLKIVPSSIKTIIIGDGKWVSGEGYYMSTDVGYLRMIWYVGIIGLLNFVIYTSFLTFNKIKMKDKNYKLLRIFLFIFILITNIKGFSEPTYIYFILFFLK